MLSVRTGWTCNARGQCRSMELKLRRASPKELHHRWDTSRMDFTYIVINFLEFSSLANSRSAALRICRSLRLSVPSHLRPHTLYRSKPRAAR